jgi:hypothetical protein
MTLSSELRPFTEELKHENAEDDLQYAPLPKKFQCVLYIAIRGQLEGRKYNSWEKIHIGGNAHHKTDNRLRPLGP